MKILDARLSHWADSYFDNTPGFYVLVDKMPKREELVYEYKDLPGGRVYYAEKEGFVDFKFARGPFERDENGILRSKQDVGYGGAHFGLRTISPSEKEGEFDVETHILQGPWSSNSGTLMSAGFHHCKEVAITDDPEVWEKGHTFLGGAVTIELIQEACRILSPLPMGVSNKFGLALVHTWDHVYVPVAVPSRQLWGQILEFPEPDHEDSFHGMSKPDKNEGRVPICLCNTPTDLKKDCPRHGEGQTFSPVTDVELILRQRGYPVSMQIAALW